MANISGKRKKLLPNSSTFLLCFCEGMRAPAYILVGLVCLGPKLAGSPPESCRKYGIGFGNDLLEFICEATHGLRDFQVYGKCVVQEEGKKMKLELQIFSDESVLILFFPMSFLWCSGVKWKKQEGSPGSYS